MNEPLAPGTAASGDEAVDPDERLTVHFLPDYTDANPYQDRLAAALRDRGVTVRVTPGGGGLFPLLGGVLGPGRPDVAHVHFLHQYLTPAGTRFPRLLAVLMAARTLFELAVLRVLGVSLVWTAHDLLNHERRAVEVERWTKHCFLRLLADEVVVHCEAAKRELLDCYRLPDEVAERMTVVPHGTFAGEYPAEVDRADARERLGLPADATVFTFFGSIRRYKQVPELVRAVDALDGVHLLVAGNPRTETVEREVRDAAAAAGTVHLALEFVPDEEVQVYMAAADAVVLPFRAGERSMLTSGSVLLAMSFGRAVVAPDIGCIGAYVGDGGVVYEPGELEAALERALAADLDAMGERARTRAAALDWDGVAADTLSVYRAARR